MAKKNNLRSGSFNPTPVTRLEKFLAAIAGLVNAPTPVTRKEYWMSKTAARIKAIEEGGGGGGGEYTAGYGIDIDTNNEISVDKNEIALKSNLTKVYAKSDSGKISVYKKFNLFNDNGEIVGEVIELNVQKEYDWTDGYHPSGSIYVSEMYIPFDEIMGEFYGNYHYDFIDASVKVSADAESNFENAWGSVYMDYEDSRFLCRLFSTSKTQGAYLHVIFSLTALFTKYF